MTDFRRLETDQDYRRGYLAGARHGIPAPADADPSTIAGHRAGCYTYILFHQSRYTASTRDGPGSAENGPGRYYPTIIRPGYTLGPMPPVTFKPRVVWRDTSYANKIARDRLERGRRRVCGNERRGI